jgi:hypothetical protein
VSWNEERKNIGFGTLLHAFDRRKVYITLKIINNKNKNKNKKKEKKDKKRKGKKKKEESHSPFF